MPMTTTAPEPGATGILALPGHGSHQVRVEWRSGELLAVALFARLPVLASSLIGASARLSYANARGLHRVAVAVLGTHRGGILELTMLGAAETDQRREHVRVAAPLPGVVAPADGARPPLHTYTIDVSGAGVLIAGAGPVQIGDAVAVTLKVPGADDPVTALSHIVRVEEDGHVAVAFDALGERERERLVRFVFERQRLERRAARDGR